MAEMPYSFEAFLRERKLGKLSLSDSKSSILFKMGMPSWWEGRGTASCDQSDVWAYGDLGIVFTNDHVVKLEVAFSITGPANKPHLPRDITFTDINVSCETTVDEFIKYLSFRSIAFDEESGDFGTTLIKVRNGAVAAFRHLVKHERSVTEEKRIVSDEKQLVSVSVVQQGNIKGTGVFY